MRKCLLLLAAGLGLCVGAPAESQALYDTIGQMMWLNSSYPDSCYDGSTLPKPKDLAKGDVRAERLLAKYRQIALAGMDLSAAFISDKSHRSQLDGQPRDVHSAPDPWIGKAARFERVALSVGNWGGYAHAQWRALAADGTTLGLYDGWTNANGSRFVYLDLYSPATTAKPMSNTPFCSKPGDAEEWREAKAKREAEKAAKRAAREAARASGG